MVIEIRDVTFGYSPRRRVFEQLNLVIDSFPAVVLGPNGAGKSTLLGLIAGHLKPREGTVQVAGHGRTASPIRLRAKTGWLPQDVPALSGFSLRQQVAYAGWLKGMRYSEAWLNATDALEAVSLRDQQDQRSRKLSGGQRRRLGIAQALVHVPSLLVLDEPYAGLDPEQRSSVRDTLLAVSTETSLLVSTHQTDDLEDVYAYVLVIDGGRVVFAGPIVEFYASVPWSTPPSMRAEVAYRQILKTNLPADRK